MWLCCKNSIPLQKSKYLLGNLVFKQKIKLRKLQQLSFIFKKPLIQRIQMWKNIGNIFKTYLCISERNVWIPFKDVCVNIVQSVAEFKEFERRFKFKPRFKYGWFHLKLYQMFQDLNRVLADLNRGLNSLNSISDQFKA